MPWKSKTARQKASRIAIARAFLHSSNLLDVEMITTPPETFTSLNSEIIIDLNDEDINEGIDLEGHSPLGLEGSSKSEAKLMRMSRAMLEKGRNLGTKAWCAFLIKYIFPYLVIRVQRQIHGDLEFITPPILTQSKICLTVLFVSLIESFLPEG